MSYTLDVLVVICNTYQLNMGFYFSRYRVEERRLKVKFRPELVGRRLADINHELHRMFDAIIERVRQDYGPRDKARLYIDANNFHKYLVVHLREIHTLNADALVSRIEKLLQSDETLTLDHSFMVSVGVQVQDEAGGPHTRKYMVNIDESDPFNDVFKRRCVIEMKNKDQLCVARSLVICEAAANKDKAYKNLTHPANSNSMGKKGLLNRALALQKKNRP